MNHSTDSDETNELDFEDLVTQTASAVKASLSEREKHRVALFLRVADAAKKGGASDNDIWGLACLVIFNGGIVDRWHMTQPTLRAKYRSENSLRQINTAPTMKTAPSGREYVSKPVSDDERNRILAADKALAREYPIRAVRYRAIAKQEGHDKHDRVRRIIERSLRGKNG